VIDPRQTLNLLVEKATEPPDGRVEPVEIADRKPLAGGVVQDPRGSLDGVKDPVVGVIIPRAGHESPLLGQIVEETSADGEVGLLHQAADLDERRDRSFQDRGEFSTSRSVSHGLARSPTHRDWVSKRSRKIAWLIADPLTAGPRSARVVIRDRAGSTGNARPGRAG